MYWFGKRAREAGMIASEYAWGYTFRNGTKIKQSLLCKRPVSAKRLRNRIQSAKPRREVRYVRVLWIWLSWCFRKQRLTIEDNGLNEIIKLNEQLELYQPSAKATLFSDSSTKRVKQKSIGSFFHVRRDGCKRKKSRLSRRMLKEMDSEENLLQEKLQSTLFSNRHTEYSLNVTNKKNMLSLSNAEE